MYFINYWIKEDISNIFLCKVDRKIAKKVTDDEKEEICLKMKARDPNTSVGHIKIKLATLHDVSLATVKRILKEAEKKTKTLVLCIDRKNTML